MTSDLELAILELAILEGYVVKLLDDIGSEIAIQELTILELAILELAIL
jgi:hypothetical protein